MVVNESFLRDALRLVVWYPIRWLIRALPIKNGFLILRMMGDLHYCFSRGKAAVLKKNMNSVLGLDENCLQRAVRGYFRNHYVNQLQVFLFPRLKRGNIEKFHTFKGIENLDRAIDKGKGCILLHPHFGPAQLPLHALGIKGYPMMQIGLPTDEGRSYIGRKVSFNLRLKYEGMIAGRIVSADSFLRPAIEWLKENKVLMMTGDGAGGGRLIGKFMRMEFLGRPMLLPIGSAILAKKTGAALVPMFTLPDGNGAYKSIIHRPITGDEAEAISIFAGMLGEYVRRYPHFWHFWDELEYRIQRAVSFQQTEKRDAVILFKRGA